MNKTYRVFLLLSFMFTVSGATSCGSGDGECLSHGENCSGSYIDDNYGGKRPPCCNGQDQCQESPSGYYLTCN